MNDRQKTDFVNDMMKNKGAMEWNIGTMIIIVLSISMLILGMVLLKNIFDKPKFKITEKVCNERERIVNVSIIDNETYEFSIWGGNSGKGTVTISNPLDCINNSYCIGYEIICEDIEVEEIIINKTIVEIWEQNKSEQYKHYSVKEFCNAKNGEYIDLGEVLKCNVTLLYFLNQKKQNLTIEWLDENCEIRDWECPNSNSNVCNGYDENTKILEYKCGDYKVEVKNEI